MLKVYISPHCFLCRFIEPIARIFGVAIFKLHPDGKAVQVNGSLVENAGWIPATPTFVIGKSAFVGLPKALALVAIASQSRRGKKNVR